MPFLVLHVVFSFVLDPLHIVTQRDHDRAVQLLRLRQQLRLYERNASQPRPSRWERADCVVDEGPGRALAEVLGQGTGGLRAS